MSQLDHTPREIPLTKSMVAVVCAHDYERVGHIKWCSHNGGYACRRKMVEGKYRMSLLHRVIAGALAGEEVDHINRNKLDNRCVNLRRTDHIGNSRNHGLISTNRTGVTGVGFHKQRNKWRAWIGAGDSDKTLFLGHFETMEKAVEARRKAEQEYGYL